MSSRKSDEPKNMYIFFLPKICSCNVMLVLLLGYYANFNTQTKVEKHCQVEKYEVSFWFRIL